MSFRDTKTSALLCIRFLFKTTNENGLLVYAFGNERQQLGLYLENNDLKLFSSFDNVRAYFAESKLNLTNNFFNEIEIKIWINATSTTCSININLNGTALISATQQLSHPFMHRVVLETFYFGDVPRGNFVAAKISPFEGCIRDININEKERHLSESSAWREVAECEAKQICEKKPCKNSGLCQQLDADTWKCVCQAGINYFILPPYFSTFMAK